MVVVAADDDFREVNIVSDISTVKDNDAWEKCVADGEVFAASSCWGGGDVTPRSWNDCNVDDAVGGEEGTMIVCSLLAKVEATPNYS